MMGMWFITSFIGNLLQGYIGSYFSQMDKTQFFLMCAGIGALAGAITLAFDRPLRAILEAGPPQPSPVPSPRPAE